MSYYNRGIIYGMSRNYKSAVENIKIAARLGLKEAQDYLSTRGIEW